MARPLDLERRRVIVQCAKDVIRERGPHRTTMSHVAVAAEMKRPTLYWYFKDVGELCEGILDEANRELETFVLERIAGIDHPLRLLDAVVTAQQDFFSQHSELVTVLAQLWGSGPPRLTATQARFRDSIHGRLVAVVREAVNDGVIAECDPDALVSVVLAAGDGALIQHVAIGLDPKTTLDGLRAHILAPLERTSKRTPKLARKRKTASR